MSGVVEKGSTGHLNRLMRRTCKRRTEVDFQQRVNSEIPLNSLTFETFATEEILHVCFRYVFVFLSLSKLF